MPSLITALLSASLGFLCYILVAMAAPIAPIEVRQQIGGFYGKLGARCLKQWTFCRRILSGYDIKVITVDEEQKLLKATLSSPLLGDDNEFRFKDPDNRILRLMNKPVALSCELIPAAVDAELAEEGHHLREKKTDEGLWKGDRDDPDDEVVVDPFVSMDDHLRLVDPIDVFNLVSNDIDTEDIKTAEEKTKQRFTKYGANFDPIQGLVGAMGFFSGLGGIMGLQYFQTELMDGGSSGGLPSGPSFPMHVPSGVVDVAVDVAVMLA